MSVLLRDAELSPAALRLSVRSSDGAGGAGCEADGAVRSLSGAAGDDP